MKEIAIIVDLNSIRLIVPEGSISEGYMEQAVRAELWKRLNDGGYGNFMENYFEDECQDDVTENTGE
jgi:hypothetical protein